MKKVLSIILAAVLALSAVFVLSGCGKKENAKYDVVLITDGGAINDKGYNQSAWNGVKAFCEASEDGLSYRYYQPLRDENDELTVENIKNYIDLAAKDGAKYVVLPGEDFAVAAYEIAPTYSDISFVLVDALPHSKDDTTLRLQSNVMNITFDTLQAGFLAGYSSVIDGNTKLGYVGSVNSSTSGNYGAGFVQGASFAADELQTPVQLDYADYDSPNLDYDYSFTVKPVYQKIEDSYEQTFKVNVVDGIGTGVYNDGENVKITCNPAPEGKTFDHWEVKSDTEGVKDKKVNISSKTDWQMNLLVGDCDCTITAVWADVDTVKIDIYDAEGSSVAETVNTPVDGASWVTAPVAKSGYVFDHWETSDTEAVEDINSKGTMVNVQSSNIELYPQYVKSENPTFDVTVLNGTGSGSYVTDDEIEVTADPPQDGYMFYKWENVDNQGLSTGIKMDNEFNYTTKFNMVDRFASIAESMYDEGTQVVFGGGNPLSDSIFLATWEFDYPVYAFGHGIDEADKGNCLASVVTDYGEAVKLALESYKGGSIFTGNCSNGCIYVTGKNLEEFQLDENGDVAKDKEGKEIKNKDYNEHYAVIYKALADNKLSLKSVQSGGDVRKAYSSACLTLNYKVKN